MKTIVVYYHRKDGGLRVRNCTHTAYPLDYDKNTNQKPGPGVTKNFNRWAEDIKEAVHPSEKVANRLLEEAKELVRL